MFTIIAGNKLEALVGQLCNEFRENPPGIFQKEQILVQSRGMERWLKIQMANRNGFCGALEFPFPAGYVNRYLQSVFEGGADKVFASSSMTWQIYDWLPQLTQLPGYEDLKKYLAPDFNALKRYQLAEQIADLFDQYTIWRPGMILNWDGIDARGWPGANFNLPENQQWQYDLWRRLVAQNGNNHFPNMLYRFLSGERPVQQPVPRRLTLFGFSTLPPIILSFFECLSQQDCEITLYYLTPCEYFWKDIRSEKEIFRKLLEQQDEFWDIGNPLLASMGVAGRDFSGKINDIDAMDFQLFIESADRTALEMIQNDIQMLRDEDVRLISNVDRSVQVHCCHSRLREVEVLYDQLLRLLDEDPELKAHEILVMAPDIHQYSAYIDAVFGNPENDRQRIPYTVADHSVAQRTAIAEALVKILNMADSRYMVSEVMDLFETEAVYRRFGINEEELPTIRKWLENVRIRWGIDEDFRKACGFSSFKENSWIAGLERLLLGTAMNMDFSQGSFDGIIPCDMLAGEAEILGNFLDFCRKIMRLGEGLRQRRSRSFGKWHHLLMRIIDEFFIEDQETASGIQSVISTVSQMTSEADEVTMHELIPLEVVATRIEHLFGDDSAGYGFLQRGITFCQLLPMRSIPAKVVVLLGMNEGEFPRQPRNVSFNLITSNPIPGDRSVRNEDRYLFLEAMISARQNLIVSYVGRTDKANEEVPPSVVLSELLDYLRGFQNESGKCGSEALMTEHTLQAFNPKYFDGRMFSYSQAACRAAEALIGRAERTGQGIEAVTATEEPKFVSLSDLISFVRKPVDFFMRNSFAVSPDIYDDALPPDSEIFNWQSGLEGYQLRQEVVEMLLDGCDHDTVRNWLDAEGMLPPGELKGASFDDVLSVAGTLADEVKKGTGLESACECIIEETFDAVEFMGQLPTVYPSQQVLYRCGSLRPVDSLGAWIKHLALQLSENPVSTSIFTLMKGSVVETCLPVLERDEARSHLEKIIRLYQSAVVSPQLFFPDCGWEYIKNCYPKSKRSAAAKLEEDERPAFALAQAALKWSGGEFGGEWEGSPGARLWFSKEFPAQEGEEAAKFIEICEAIIKPLYDYMTEGGK